MEKIEESKFGFCEKCEDIELEPVWFKEQEFIKGVWTGRTRTACSHLVCPCCMKNYAVDDSFDGPWR